MWTRKTRAEHDRDELRYPSDLTDAEWQILEPLLPPPAVTGRHRSCPRRELINAIFCVLRGGGPWHRAAGPFPTAPDDSIAGSLAFATTEPGESLNHPVVMRDRERAGRGGQVQRRGHSTTRASKPLKLVARADMMLARRSMGASVVRWSIRDGRGLKLQVHPASIQDRDGAIPLLRASRAWYPFFIERVFADSAYVAERVANATSIIVEIVRKLPGQVGFAVHPRRWVVERFFAWLEAQSPSGKGLRGYHHLGYRIPLCRIRHAAHTTIGSFGLRSEFWVLASRCAVAVIAHLGGRPT